MEIWRTQCWRIPQYDSTLKVHSIRLSSSLRENVIFREGDKKFFHRKQISERRDMTGVINFINDSFLAVCPDKNIYLHPKKFKKTLLHKRTLESGKGNVSFFVIPVIEQVLDWYDWTLDYELDFFDDEFFENTSLLSEEIVRIKRQRIEEINRQIRLRNVQASLIEKKQEKTEPVLTQPAKFEPVKISPCKNIETPTVPEPMKLAETKERTDKTTENSATTKSLDINEGPPKGIISKLLSQLKRWSIQIKWLLWSLLWE